MSMSVDGLVSGMDTTSLITQLIQAEAAPQTALKARLSATQTAASAYRTANTTFLAITAAAEALTSSGVSTARKVSSSNSAVTASAVPTAITGSSLTFSVTALASTQTIVSKTSWATPTTDVRASTEPAWPIEILDSLGATKGTVDVAAGATLTDAVTAINDADLGVRAAILKVGDTYRLQLTAETGGSAGAFTVKSATEDAVTAGSGFVQTSAGQDATLDLGGGLTATSSTNTFADLLAGVSVTVSKVDATPVTLTVSTDTDSVTTKVQAMVDAVNAALTEVKRATSNAPGSTATLKGDPSLNSLAGRLLDAVSAAVGPDGSAAKIGIQLTRDGKITFDKTKMATALRDDPALVSRMMNGTPASLGVDGVVGGGNDVAEVPGLAARVLAVSKNASDATTGSIVALAKGKDTLIKDYQDRIAAWDLRLVKRKEMLTRQFTAMETALSSLKNQSTWLAGQINSLPTS